jgi:hypothetical protein
MENGHPPHPGVFAPLPATRPALRLSSRPLLWLVESGGQNEMAAHPRAVGLDATGPILAPTSLGEDLFRLRPAHATHRSAPARAAPMKIVCEQSVGRGHAPREKKRAARAQPFCREIITEGKPPRKRNATRAQALPKPRSTSVAVPKNSTRRPRHPKTGPKRKKKTAKSLPLNPSRRCSTTHSIDAPPPSPPPINAMLGG